MKKLIFVAAFLWLNVANSQSLTRETSEPVKIDTLTLLEYASGFRLIDGDWIGFDRKDKKHGKDLGFNAIPTSYFFFDDGGYSDWSLSRSINFKHIKVFSAEYKDNKFLIFNFLKYSGRYKYPNIRKDWYEIKEDRFLVISVEDFEVFKNNFPAKINQAYRETISVFQDKTFRSDLDDFDLEKKIRLTIESSQRDYLKPKIVFDIFPVDFEGQKVVRFNFEVLGNYSESSNPFKPENFNTAYFESPWNEFSSFLKY